MAHLNWMSHHASIAMSNLFVCFKMFTVRISYLLILVFGLVLFLGKCFFAEDETTVKSLSLGENKEGIGREVGVSIFSVPLRSLTVRSTI
jgi:hypothetical protein